jgi:hypothetical protein
VRRLCAGLEIAGYSHLDRHDGRSGIEFLPVGGVFEQQLDGLDEVGLRSLDRVALANDVQFEAAGHVSGAFLVDGGSQAHVDRLALTVRDGGWWDVSL